MGTLHQSILGFAKATKEAIADLKARVAAIEGREERPAAIDFASQHKGVWKAARAYNRNDLVQWQGAAWFARKDSPDGRPGESPDWGQFFSIPRAK